ncbi:cysteine desulfurase-like protein [Couchioplanes caeruleus]|uniref:cysteine desulfurase-like protein n=1 Tax=Couchioplanes caeruleus TaxID=56438 RepID=UPI00201BE82F|nr:cysteine desulfurase-like protein [Couchioplanes caeruleus]UQU62731.1 cysteine desulfurase-like protein [Couchioplanes caeruleus]
MSDSTHRTTAGAELDVARIRAHFPALAQGAAHFDGPGGSQTPDVVADAIRDTLLSPLANRGTTTAAERNAERAVTQCRAALADLLRTTADSVIVGRSMTALTFDMSRMLAAQWSPGDEIVVSRLDHDANVRPWVIAAERAGVTVRWMDFDVRTGELTVDALHRQLSGRTRLVAVTAASNLIGTMPDIPAFADAAHDAGARLYVDGVHYTAHTLVDVGALKADFFACSPYKFLGPHCGVVTGRPELLEELRPDKLLPSPDRVPERFELGTLPYELMAGTTAAVTFLAGLAGADGSRRQRLEAGMALVERHEDRLRARIEDGLSRLPGVTVHSRARRRTPTLLVTFDGVEPAAVSTFLAGRGVNAPAGSFYAHETAEQLGLGKPGGLRIGLAPYNDDADVDRLLTALDDYFTG